MMFLKIKTFLKSLLFHIYSGFPKSTQEQIEKRYEICIACEKFNKEKSECGVCGCAISRNRVFMNKLAWADQSCPLQKWTKLV